MNWLVTLERLARPLTQRAMRLRRGLTLGVRGLVVDAEGRVLLVKHTYLRGWHLPGGGVERGETCQAALARELVEEAGVRITGRPSLLSIHSQEAQFPGDHVLVYRVEGWEPCAPTSRGEIAEIAWFAPDALPEDATRGARRRISEALGGAESSEDW
jgi:ADP-ribose pyrophosphatase YjhB (NUDIX family)